MLLRYFLQNSSYLHSQMCHNNDSDDQERICRSYKPSRGQKEKSVDAPNPNPPASAKEAIHAVHTAV